MNRNKHKVGNIIFFSLDTISGQYLYHIIFYTYEYVLPNFEFPIFV